VSVAFSSELRARAEELVGRYPVGRSALLPLLHLVQHTDGYISDGGVAECADLLGLTKAEVAAVATFYTMFKRQQLGAHLVSVCTNFSCKVRGAQEVYERLADKLGVGHNQTTADGRFTLEHAECLGNCEGAPVVTLDYLNYECMTPEAALELIDRVAAGDIPPPTRGFLPPGVREIEHRLAGLGPREGGPHDDIGAASAQARADDGAVPAPQAGPGAQPVPVEPTFAEHHEAEREAAKALVREAGHEPGAVEDAAGARAREFPTIEPDWEPKRPGEGRAPHRDAATEGVQPEFAGEAGEGDLGAEETGPRGLGPESGTGGGHEYGRRARDEAEAAPGAPRPEDAADQAGAPDTEGEEDR
jgi:NADH-quinone oxidoreductase subunit E